MIAKFWNPKNSTIDFWKGKLSSMLVSFCLISKQEGIKILVSIIFYLIIFIKSEMTWANKNIPSYSPPLLEEEASAALAVAAAALSLALSSLATSTALESLQYISFMSPDVVPRASHPWSLASKQFLAPRSLQTNFSSSLIASHKSKETSNLILFFFNSSNLK